MGDHIQNLPKSKGINTQSSSKAHKSSQIITENSQVGQAQFELVNSYLLFPKTPSLCAWTASMRICSKDFSETEVKLIGLPENGCGTFHFE